MQEGEEPFDSQEHLIKQAQVARAAAVREEAERAANRRQNVSQVDSKEAAKAVEAKIAEAEAAQAAAPAPRPKPAAPAAQAPRKGGIISGVLGALFKPKGPRR